MAVSKNETPAFKCALQFFEMPALHQRKISPCDTPSNYTRKIGAREGLSREPSRIFPGSFLHRAAKKILWEVENIGLFSKLKTSHIMMTPPNWTIIYALPMHKYISTHAMALKKEKVREKP